MANTWAIHPIILICPQESLRAKAPCKVSCLLLSASCFSLGSSLPPKTDHSCKIGISKFELWIKLNNLEQRLSEIFIDFLCIFLPKVRACYVRQVHLVDCKVPKNLQKKLSAGPKLTYFFFGGLSSSSLSS